MDAEHERCAAALETLRQDLKPASLAAVLKEVETHFAHEEELLDRYVYKQPAGGGGFSADAGARKSHRADHTKILSEIRTACERAEREGTVPMEIVTRVEDEFERHADQFDGKTHGSFHCWLLGCILPRVPAIIVRTGHYAERMSAAIAAEHPAAAAAAAKQPCNGGC